MTDLPSAGYLADLFQQWFKARQKLTSGRTKQIFFTLGKVLIYTKGEQRPTWFLISMPAFSLGGYWNLNSRSKITFRL